MPKNREEITGDAIDTVLAALKDWADGKPAGQNVVDVNAALDQAEAAGITRDEYRRYER